MAIGSSHFRPLEDQKRGREAAFSCTRIHAQAQANEGKQTQREHRGVHLNQWQRNAERQIQVIQQEADQKWKEH